MSSMSSSLTTGAVTAAAGAGSNAIEQSMLAEDTRFQILWNEHMRNRTKFVRYKRTAVLLLYWTRTDLTRIETEVDNLKRVFEEDYKFEVQKAFVDSDQRPQKQINKHLADFVAKWDGPETLLIVYYAGHGFSPESNPEQFVLVESTTLKVKAKKLEWNKLVWNRAESNLEDTEADIFAIFDCCYAGRLCQSRSPCRFEYLGACSADQTTEPPGDQSFTSALIWALRELKDKTYFPTSELQQMIGKARHFPKFQYPPLGHRMLPSQDHIVIAPHRDSISPISPASTQPAPQPEAWEFLDLRFQFACPINEDLIIKTANALHERMIVMDESHTFDGCRVSFLRKQSYKPIVKEVVDYWQRSVRGALAARIYARRWLRRYRASRSGAIADSVKSSSPAPFKQEGDEIASTNHSPAPTTPGDSSSSHPPRLQIPLFDAHGRFTTLVIPANAQAGAHLNTPSPTTRNTTPGSTSTKSLRRSLRNKRSNSAIGSASSSPSSGKRRRTS